jgi:hypothetical protein
MIKKNVVPEPKISIEYQAYINKITIRTFKQITSKKNWLLGPNFK